MSDRKARFVQAEERVRVFEAKYDGKTFHEAFGNGWPEGGRPGEVAIDYLEWSHSVSTLDGEKLKQRKGKGANQS